jgi:hypothetical protein
MYFAVAPQRRDLFNELDLAMGRIDIMNPGFFVRSRRYMEGESNSIPVFSQAEEDYIKQAPPSGWQCLRMPCLFPICMMTECCMVSSWIYSPI